MSIITHRKCLRRVLRSAAYLTQWMRMMLDNVVRNGGEVDGNVRSEHEEDEGMTDNGDSDNDWYR